MKKHILFRMAIPLLAVSISLASCTGTEKQKKELANAEEEALKKANDALSLTENDSKKEISKVKDDLEKANEKLNEKQTIYLQSLQEKEESVSNRLKSLNERIKSTSGEPSQRLVERRDKLSKERDMLQANIMELKSPMNDQRLETVEKELKVLIAAIDRELESE